LAVHWVVGRLEAFLLTTGDVEILPRLLDAAERLERRPSDPEMAELAGRAGAEPLFVQYRRSTARAPASAPQT
jgi:hypothetical protein